MLSLLHVGNLVSGVTDTELRGLFDAYGSVLCALVITHHKTGRSKGFGYVEMGTEAEARAAVLGLHNRGHAGRSLRVVAANPVEEHGGDDRGAAEGGP